MRGGGRVLPVHEPGNTNGHRPGKVFLVLRKEVTLREAEGIHVTDRFRVISCEGPPKNNQMTRTIQLNKKSLRAYCVLVLGLVVGRGIFLMAKYHSLSPKTQSCPNADRKRSLVLLSSLCAKGNNPDNKTTGRRRTQRDRLHGKGRIRCLH